MDGLIPAIQDLVVLLCGATLAAFVAFLAMSSVSWWWRFIWEAFRDVF